MSTHGHACTQQPRPCAVRATSPARQAALLLPAAKQRCAGYEAGLSSERDKLVALEAELGKEQKNLSDLDEGKWYAGKFLTGREKENQKKEDAREAVAVGETDILCICVFMCL